MQIEEIKKMLRQKNLTILRKEINAEWVLVKIQNHLERHPHLKYSVEEVQLLILENDLVGSFFIKDPGKQNISENYIAKQIEGIEGISSFKHLATTDYCYLLEGKLKRLPNKPLGLKNLDFVWRYEEFVFAASQKYTKDEGGAQDNQFNDLISFLKGSISREGAVPVALVDGEYYQRNDRISLLKNINSRAIVCSYADLEKEMKEWIKNNS